MCKLLICQAKYRMTAMRLWLNLCETLCEGATANEPNLIAAIKHELDARGLEISEERNPDGLPDDEIIAELIYDAEQQLDQAGAELSVYRAISMADLSQLRTQAVGQSWSLEEDMALPYQGDQTRFYRLHARVATAYIDRQVSIIMQVVYEEREVVVTAGSPMQIIMIILCTPGHEQPVDSPLVGQTLRA
jgi:hypothetical protein